VEFDLTEDRIPRFEYPLDVLEEKMNAWKRGLTDVLSDSPSKGRKFLRWRIVYRQYFTVPKSYCILKSGELEVLPRTSL